MSVSSERYFEVQWKTISCRIQMDPARTLGEMASCAAKKLGWNESASPCLRFQGKILDLGLPIRLAGLPQGVKLELFSETSKVQPLRLVRVAVQLPDGIRKTSTTAANLPIWDVLLHFERETGLNLLRQMKGSDYMAPSVQVLGRPLESLSDLATVSLQSLGITDSVVLRIQYSPVKNLTAEEALLLVEQIQSSQNASSSNPSDRSESVAEPPSKTLAEMLSSASTEMERRVIVKAAQELSVNEIDSTPDEALASVPVIQSRGDRLKAIFKPAQFIRRANLPDSFFKVQASDLPEDFKNRKKSENPSEQPLMTRRMRESLDAKKKTTRKVDFSDVLIKFKFPCGHVVLAMFAPGDDVECVHQFVRGCIRISESVSLIPGGSSSTLPLTNCSVSKAGLSPQSLVRVHIPDMPVDSPSVLKPELLKAAIDPPSSLDNYSNYSQVLKVNKNIDDHNDHDDDDHDDDNDDDDGAMDRINIDDPSYPTQFHRSEMISTKIKVPKWYRP